PARRLRRPPQARARPPAGRPTHARAPGRRPKRSTGGNSPLHGTDAPSRGRAPESASARSPRRAPRRAAARRAARRRSLAPRTRRSPRGDDAVSRQRAAAIGALALAAGGLALAVVVAAEAFPRGLIALVLVAFGAAAAWYALLHVGALLLAAAIVLVAKDRLLAEALVVGAFVLSTALGRAAFAQRVRLPPQPPPRRAVLFYNPKSGGGKAERFRLADEARARGIEPVELRLDDDLTRLVRDAVAGGADGLAMAGGDGSQAIVAAIAAEHDLPYACVPAGTRNHFALDLGVDR